MPCEICIKQFYLIYFLTRENISKRKQMIFKRTLFRYEKIIQFINSLNHDESSISYEEQCTFAVTHSKFNFR